MSTIQEHRHAAERLTFTSWQSDTKENSRTLLKPVAEHTTKANALLRFMIGDGVGLCNWMNECGQ